MRKKVGFIGAGYMGYGIAKNILNKNFDLNVIAHKNRKPIEKLVKLGAKEFFNYNDLVKDIDCLIICVTNTPIAKDVAKEILDKLLLYKQGLIFQVEKLLLQWMEIYKMTQKTFLNYLKK